MKRWDPWRRPTFTFSPVPVWILCPNLSSTFIHALSLSLSGFLPWIFNLPSLLPPSTWIAAAVLLGVLFLRSLHRLWIFVGVLASAPAVQAMRLFPRTAGERTKAAIRMSKPPVPSGRPVLRVTMQRRTQLPNEFFMWATEQGPDIAALFEHHQRHIDDINLVV